MRLPVRTLLLVGVAAAALLFYYYSRVRPAPTGVNVAIAHTGSQQICDGVVVRLDAARTLTVDDASVPVEQLNTRLAEMYRQHPGRTAFLEASPDLQVQDVTAVLEILRRHASNVSLTPYKTGPVKAGCPTP